MAAELLALHIRRLGKLAMATSKRSRGSSPRKGKSGHVSPARQGPANESERYAIDSAYPGALRIELNGMFRDEESRQALERVRQAVAAARELWAATNELKPAEAWRLTDIQWSRERGSRFDGVGASCHWEATVPAAGLSKEELRMLESKARSTCRAPRRRQLGQLSHFKEIQDAAEVLASRCVAFWRETDAEVDESLYFIGAQVSVSGDAAVRGRHVDPAPIAAALATFTLEGAAAITLDCGYKTNEKEFKCDGSHVYMLTGSALVHPVHHAVRVLTEQRISVTLRFADRSESRARKRVK